MMWNVCGGHGLTRWTFMNMYEHGVISGGFSDCYNRKRIAYYVLGEGTGATPARLRTSVRARGAREWEEATRPDAWPLREF
jgi:hypothetical protein